MLFKLLYHSIVSRSSWNHNLSFSLLRAICDGLLKSRVVLTFMPAWAYKPSIQMVIQNVFVSILTVQATNPPYRFWQIVCVLLYFLLCLYVYCVCVCLSVACVCLSAYFVCKFVLVCKFVCVCVCLIMCLSYIGLCVFVSVLVCWWGPWLEWAGLRASVICLHMEVWFTNRQTYKCNQDQIWEADKTNDDIMWNQKWYYNMNQM